MSLHRRIPHIDGDSTDTCILRRHSLAMQRLLEPALDACAKAQNTILLAMWHVTTKLPSHAHAIKHAQQPRLRHTVTIAACHICQITVLSSDLSAATIMYIHDVQQIGSNHQSCESICHNSKRKKAGFAKNHNRIRTCWDAACS